MSPGPYFGSSATTRQGAPEPPPIFMGSAVMRAPRGGSRSSPGAVPPGGPEPDGRVKRLGEVPKFVEEWQEPLETPLVDEIMDDEE